MTDCATLLSLWDQCLNRLQADTPSDQFNTWLRPLHAQEHNQCLTLFAPNQFVLKWVEKNYLSQIHQLISQINPDAPPNIKLTVGSIPKISTTSSSPIQANTSVKSTSQPAQKESLQRPMSKHQQKSDIIFGGVDGLLTGNINTRYTFDNHVVGDSNRLARAAGMQVANDPGSAYNPLFLYGGVGLGKTHLIHAMADLIKKNNPSAKILYLHSERFVADMIKALQRNAMDAFKKFYRSINCLLIDDIQFFANKERSQEEFFHTFNYLLDGKQQIVLTCDRYPKEIRGLEERLQSRFGWGLTVAIEPPGLETRVAILLTKAEQYNTELPQDVAFFIAKHIQSNVRELEGALKRIIANAQFTGETISVPFAREALKDLLTLQAKLVTIENIQKIVADYYKIKVSDLLSPGRARSITRPRQLAMLLAKDLTNHSLPEIGKAFGGRDHTTVLHAYRKMKDLLASNLSLQEDHKILLRMLSA